MRIIVNALFLGPNVARLTSVFSRFLRTLFGKDRWCFYYNWRLVTEVAAGLLRVLGLKYTIRLKDFGFLVLQGVAQTQIAVLLSRQFVRVAEVKELIGR